MKRLLLVLLVVLGTAASAGAVAITTPIDDSDISTVGYGERSLVGFSIALPEELTLENFLGACLKLEVAAVEAEEGSVELEIAEWLTNAPVVPARKDGYISELVPATDSSIIRFDMTPIIHEALAAERYTVDIVVGNISADALGELRFLTGEPNNRWGEFTLHVK